MNFISKSLSLAGGVAAAAGIVTYGGKWGAKCKYAPESSPSATWGDQDYCFYCGRGGREKVEGDEEVMANPKAGEDRASPKRLSDCSIARSAAINRARSRVESAMVKFGVPGCVVAVMKDGELIWSEGLGWTDVENDVDCSPSSGEEGREVNQSMYR